MSIEIDNIKNDIENGKAILGIELGSTRIKAVLINENHKPIASGSYEWENKYENNLWTYSLTDIWTGLQQSYQQMVQDVKNTYGVMVKKLAAIGFSAMMHGYMVFDKAGELLTPFRTWRNTNTEQAAAELTKVFNYPIPQRWSIAHLYQAILNNEQHVKNIDFQTTLAGYIHWKLTGQKVLGVGEASGMFPIDIESCDFNTKMIEQFDKLVAHNDYNWKLKDILPNVMPAGENGGALTAEGAKLLDITGNLQGGIPVCPPEGDAGTGMVATNSVAVRTGNVSAGTSIFAMLVLEKELKAVHKEIDLVTTPDGHLVAMVHCNNCTSDLNAWVSIFKEFTKSLNIEIDMTKLFSTLYTKALEGDADCGGLLAYNYFSGEPVTGFEEGRLLFVRSPESKFNLANFMRVNLLTSLASLKIGLDILLKEESVKIDTILGHGGLFKTKEVGQKLMAAAINAPVSVMETAGEGGAWGIALLAAYMLQNDKNISLNDYLCNKVFADKTGTSINPDPQDVKGFDEFINRYKKGLPIERAAVDYLK